MKVKIPNQDVPVIDVKTGFMTIEWYDALKNLEKLGLLDLADVPNTTTPTNGQKPTWNAATSKWTWV